MDFHTLFICDLTSLVISTFALCALALANPKIRGLRWFAIYLLADLCNPLLSLLRGHPPLGLTLFLSRTAANACNDLSFIAMYLGFHWFILRAAKPNRFALIVMVAAVIVHVAAYPLAPHAIWRFYLTMLPVFIVCVLSAHLCLRHARGPLRIAGRAAASVLLLQCLVSGYRTVLYTIDILRGPGDKLIVLTDQRVLVSSMFLTVLDSLFVGCFLWFYVVEFQAVLSHQARTDSLTGALNRRAFADAAAREISRAVRSATPLALIVLDLDHFKQLNDTHGHAAGDEALRALVMLLTAEVRTQDLVARSGGEEFFVLLPDTSQHRAEEVAERLRSAIERLAIPLHSSTQSGTVSITASLGVAAFHPPPGRHSMIARIRRCTPPNGWAGIVWN
jgi:diguanylate cyclase (GGDEF)-like protein